MRLNVRYSPGRSSNESSRPLQHQRQVHEDVAGHHPHRVGQEGGAAAHGVEGDGVPGVVGQPGEGVGAGGADDAADGGGLVAGRAVVGDLPGARYW